VGVSSSVEVRSAVIDTLTRFPGFPVFGCWWFSGIWGRQEVVFGLERFPLAIAFILQTASAQEATPNFGS
jgi:hypothetical protein